MMKKYIKPSLEIIEIIMEDVMSVSDVPGGEDNYNPGTNNQTYIMPAPDYRTSMKPKSE